jgi:hypothetical protein
MTWWLGMLVGVVAVALALVSRWLIRNDAKKELE